MLNIFFNNSLELLLKELAAKLATPLASPFDEEIILVQSKGMERWISLQLAKQNGICANCLFPFPRAFTHEMFRCIDPGLSEHTLFDQEFCTWKLMEILPLFLDKPGFRDLDNYLSGADHALKKLQLCRKIAETFDQYIVFRPEMLEAWQTGKLCYEGRKDLAKKELWQSMLWQALVRGHEKEQPYAMTKALLLRLEQASRSEIDLPKRVALFGISYLPPLYLTILQGLSRLMEVSIFYLNPCKEYWADSTSSRESRKLIKRTGLSFEDLHLDKGSRLLANLGKLGRDFFGLLCDLECEEIDVPLKEKKVDHLLGKIQADILHNRMPVKALAGTGFLSDRQSIQIHSCHSPMREVEVLYNALLSMFERDPSLTPRDIIVMTSDIELYAPFIQAVFSSPEDESARIPYSISDRCMRKESRVIDAFLKLLELQGERLTAPRVIDILEFEFICSKFNLVENDMVLVEKLVREAQIKWGFAWDNENKSTEEWRPNPEHINSWKAGIERLLLGYALPGEELFGGIYPCDLVEGGNADILENLLEFLDVLFDGLKSLARPRTLKEWADDLAGLVARFFKDDGDFFKQDKGAQSQRSALQKILEGLASLQEVSGFSGAIGFDLIRWHLIKKLEKEGFGGTFMGSGITFCSMLPMRSIPCKVICLIGMNENDFPRLPPEGEFDLIAADHRRGDRLVRDEDRYTFLEAIISAQDSLYISYTGQSSKEDTPVPPSVLVSELMDSIQEYLPEDQQEPEELRKKPEEKVEEWLHTTHCLQAFNPKYFDGESPRLFSYAKKDLAVAEAVAKRGREQQTELPLFIPQSLTEPEDSFKAVSVLDLCRFFAHPVKFLLNRRLGLYLGEESLVLDDAECFELDSLAKYQLEQQLVDAALGGRKPRELYEQLQASGRLPQGTPGEMAFNESAQGVEIFARETLSCRGTEPPLAPRDVDITIDIENIGEFDITGRISGIYKDKGLVQCRYAKIKAKDHLSAWILHLLLNVSEEDDDLKRSTLIGLDSKKAYAKKDYYPVSNSLEILEKLLQLYWEGLTRPLYFFPEISLDYAQRAHLKDDMQREEALEKAKVKWLQEMDNPRGFLFDEYLERCFKSRNPINADFQRYAETIFFPLLASWQKD